MRSPSRARIAAAAQLHRRCRPRRSPRARRRRHCPPGRARPRSASAMVAGGLERHRPQPLRARAWRRRPGSAFVRAAFMRHDAGALHEGVHQRAPRSPRTATRTAAPATRFLKSKRMSSSTRQPCVSMGVSSHRPSSTRNGPLTSCMSDAPLGLEQVAGGELARERALAHAERGHDLARACATPRARACTMAGTADNSRCR